MIRIGLLNGIQCTHWLHFYIIDNDIDNSIVNYIYNAIIIVITKLHYF